MTSGYKCKIFSYAIAAILLLSITLTSNFGEMINEKVSNTIPAASKLGSRGAEVKKIQTKLKKLKLFKGKIDSIYGKKTAAAVKKFQKKKKIKATGNCDAKTLKALGIKAKAKSKKKTPTNTQLLARCINGEARGEPYLGQVAVGAVIMNRVRSSQFPKTISGVIYQKGAFTAVDDGQINVPIKAGSTVVKAAKDALNGWDPTKGCLYYFNPVTATSKWIWTRKIKLKIGRHNFCV